MKRGKRDGVVGQGMPRGPRQGLGLAEGRRGLCRAQPVTDTTMWLIRQTYSTPLIDNNTDQLLTLK